MDDNNIKYINEAPENKEKSKKNITFTDEKGNKSSKSVLKLGNEDKFSSFDFNQKNDSGRYSRYYSKKKLQAVITEETTIYDILFDYITEDGKKNKNYGRVSNEIKKIEQKNEIEKLKLKKKINIISQRLDDSNNNISKNKKESRKNITIAELNLRNKTLEMKELEKDRKLNFFDLIQKLKIHPEQRTIKDILRIKPYIEKTNLVKSLYEEFTDINIIEKLINFCCIEMTYKKFHEGQIIYKIGDVPKEFYSIIFGKVNIIKAIPEQKTISGFEYFCYLMNLKKDNEIQLFHKTIETNSNNYYINENHIDVIHYIYLLNYLKSIKNKETINISFINLLELLNIKPEELGIELSQINSINYLINNTKIIKKQLHFISEQTLQKYTFLDDALIKKNVTIYKKEIYQSLKANDYFGDDVIKDQHSLTAISETTTELAVLPIKLYNSEIAVLKSVALENKISNLHSSHFFNKMKYYKFRKKYYNLFLCEKYYNGDILFKEGEKIKYIYFIKEGNIQLYITKSINEIDDLVTLLNKKKKAMKLNSFNISKKEKENELNYSIINSTYDDLINYLEKKQKHKVLFLSKNEEIGLVSNYIESVYLTSCVVVSKEAKIYKIDVEYINKMLLEEKDCMEDYNKRIENKLNLLIQRLFKINNINLVMIDEKINLEKLSKKLSDEKKKLINNPKIQGLINYKNLNNVLNEYSKGNSYPIKEDPIKLPLLSKSIKSPKRNKSPNSLSPNRDNSGEYAENSYKKNKFKMQLNYIETEKTDKKSKIYNSLETSGDNLYFELNKSIKNNSGYQKKVSKIKLQKNNHNVIEQLFITPIQNNNEAKSPIRKENNKRLMTLSYNSNLNFKKNLNNKIQLTEEDKSHNHPYYEPKMIVKRNKYKIFENSTINRKIQIENLKKHINRLKQMKKIHLTKSHEINYEYLNDNNIFTIN